MYRKTNRQLWNAGITAALGAGIVTSFAVGQGQHPAMAIAITIIAALFAVICYQYDLI